MKQWTNIFQTAHKVLKALSYKSTISKTKVLIVLDGWGQGEEQWYNAIYMANTPNWNQIFKNPKTLIQASGTYVGLPKGQPGNSEAGHIHIGAGAVVNQDFTMINQAIANGSFQKNAVFINTIRKLKKSNKSLHIFGLLSTSGTHSHQDHLFAFLDVCYKEQFSNVYLHLVLDGSDPKQYDAAVSVNTLCEHLANKRVNGQPIAKIASMIGRQYALNRSQEWTKTAMAYELLTKIEFPINQPTPLKTLKYWYQNGVVTSKCPPIRFDANGYLKDGDSFFVFNYRSDRVLQIIRALTIKNFSHFKRNRVINLQDFIGMMPYADDVPSISAFTSCKPQTTLGAVVANYGKLQLRIAETEKAAHVGRFLNGDGGTDLIHQNEERIIIESPKVSSYELHPHMAAEAITEQLLQAILQKKFDLIVANFANADMLGHTGNLEATIQAIEYIDRCLGEILSVLRKTNTEAIITSDHGNADIMYDENKQKKHLGHTTAPVPCVYLGSQNRQFHNKPGGSLVDIAPTILDMLDIPKPNVMTGKSLFKDSRTFFKDIAPEKKEDPNQEFILR